MKIISKEKIKMPVKFEDALEFVLKWEGGYSNHPDDLGGATNKGITQKRYDQFRLSKKHPIMNVKFILDYEVKEIYETYYWDVVRSKYLQAPLGLVMFDTSVNFGPAGAIRRLQKALNVPVTGLWTEDISDVVHKCDGYKIALSICNMRKAWRLYRVEKSPKQKVFLKGWLNRDNDLIDKVEEMQKLKILSEEIEVNTPEDTEEEFLVDDLLLVAEEDIDEAQ
jgi:lysozyme family protein